MLGGMGVCVWALLAFDVYNIEKEKGRRMMVM
jgi:hypothetical protein